MKHLGVSISGMLRTSLTPFFPDLLLFAKPSKHLVLSAEGRERPSDSCCLEASPAAAYQVQRREAVPACFVWSCSIGKSLSQTAVLVALDSRFADEVRLMLDGG